MPQLLYPLERPGTHYTGGWVGPRAGLDTYEKLAPTGIQSLDRPAHSQSLYRLSYLAHTQNRYFLKTEGCNEELDHMRVHLVFGRV
jgi:hypothetical protein